MDLNCFPQSATTQKTVLKISPDGYIRLPFSSFSSLQFVHLYTDHDPALCDELIAQSIPVNSAGFSECISATTPSISLGWAWYIHAHSNLLMLAAEPVRSNVMIIDMHGYDVGSATTSELISEWLQYCDWRAMVGLALRIPIFGDKDCSWVNSNPC